MFRPPAPSLCTTLFLLQLLPAALSHGHEGGDPNSAVAINMSSPHNEHMAGMEMPLPMVKAPSNITHEPTYYSHEEHSGLMLAHIIILVLAWAVVLPTAVMLSIGRSKLRLPTQVLFLAMNTAGILVSCVYSHKTPDLYENNAHHRLGWVVTWAAVVWTVLGVLTPFSKSNETGSPGPSIQPITQQAMSQYQKLQNADLFRWSQDSGHGTDRNTASLASTSRSNSWNTDLASAQIAEQDNDMEDEALEKDTFLAHLPGNRLLGRRAANVGQGVVGSVIRSSQLALERTIILLAFFAIVTGLVTYSGIGKGHHVFNVLAHLIKGGIFFWYGLLTFGRWMGCFSDFGWAWNLKPSASIVGETKAKMPSAEFVESAVICFYGASNVFLEHLSGWGRAWTAMDFEHVSITIMFFGGGLLGMLIESSRVRKVLGSAMAQTEVYCRQEASKMQTPASYTHSLNPLPSLVILLLGIMMSSHTQHTMVAGQIHKQWGYLFAAFAISRILTYVIFWLKPPTSYLPARPPTELLASFCLVSGGLIFMASNADTVSALEGYHLDAMFCFTVTMGWTCLIMSWTLVLVAIKGWAARKSQAAARVVAQEDDVA